MLCVCCPQFYLQASQGSGATFVNGKQLGGNDIQSHMLEIFSGDLVQFGEETAGKNWKEGNGKIINIFKDYIL